MQDLWSFLLQTLTASGVAVFLLILKELFRDKLSPRWQFSVWGILGLVLLMPAGSFGRHLLINWPLWVEMLKIYGFGMITHTQVLAPVPLFPIHLPQTAADWLFVAYLVGVLFLGLRYLLSYIRLRRIISRGTPISDLPALAMLQQKEQLPRCRAVRVEGISSAFVCGVIRPVLVLPADRETDSKVLLHELLHLKNRDVIWEILIACFRCIHWCNPLLWYCANQALNDMESLCDQRVLEHLEGEDRREYGKILLSMANETYARTPGTSSAANGGKNIRKRIEAIARFKKYPRGMGLVSVCILVILLGPLLVGVKTDAAVWQFPDRENQFSVMQALAAARMMPCTTFGGAIDAYAKALLTENMQYRMLCLSEAQQESLLKNIPDGWNSGLPEPLDERKGYLVCQLSTCGENEAEALLVFETEQLSSNIKKVRICTQKVTLAREENRWIVAPAGDFTTQEVTNEGPLLYGCRELPTKQYAAQTEDFLVTVDLQYVCKPESWTVPQDAFSYIGTNEAVFDSAPDPDMELNLRYSNYWAEAICTASPQRREEMTQIGISYAPWEPGTPRPQLPAANLPGSTGSGGGGEWSGVHLDPGWQNPVFLGGGGSGEYFQPDQMEMPLQIAADLYVNGGKITEMTLLPEEEQP